MATVLWIIVAILCVASCAPRHHHGDPPGSRPPCAGHTRTDAALADPVGRSRRVPRCGGAGPRGCWGELSGLAPDRRPAGRATGTGRHDPAAARPMAADTPAGSSSRTAQTSAKPPVHVHVVAASWRLPLRAVKLT